LADNCITRSAKQGRGADAMETKFAAAAHSEKRLFDFQIKALFKGQIMGFSCYQYKFQSWELKR